MVAVIRVMHLFSTHFRHGKVPPNVFSLKIQLRSQEMPFTSLYKWKAEAKSNLGQAQRLVGMFPKLKSQYHSHYANLLVQVFTLETGKRDWHFFTVC